MGQVWPLTDRQREVLEAIRELSTAGDAPTLDEIGERAGLRSSNATRRHLGILERKGFLRPRRYGKRRDVWLADRGTDAFAA